MTLFERMVTREQLDSPAQKKGVYQEAMQKIALAGLNRAGFFSRAAFYGGTCLRIFHGLRRFSEDLDFSLTAPGGGFAIEDYFDAIRKEFEMCGRTVLITRKTKSIGTAIESAFLKDMTDQINIAFTTEPAVKVKLEVDTEPPLGFNTESRILHQPYALAVRTFDLPSLFAGKMHALLFRKWARRVKGRDWYDLVWYVGNGVRLNLAHLRARTRQTNPDVRLETESDLRALLEARIEEVDFDNARLDVENFVFDGHELDLWSRGFFHSLVQMMRVE